MIPTAHGWGMGKVNIIVLKILCITKSKLIAVLLPPGKSSM